MASEDHLDFCNLGGTPTPATIRVVHIDPGPMPTFTPSAPWSKRTRCVHKSRCFSDDLNLRKLGLQRTRSEHLR